MRQLNIKFLEENHKEILEVNGKLYQEVKDNYIDGEMMFISDQLDILRYSLADWSIGSYNHNYLNIRDYGKFILAVKEMEESIPSLNDSYKSFIEDMVEKVYKCHDTEMYTEEYESLYREVKNGSKYLANEIVKNWTEILEPSRETIKQYFYEFYIDDYFSDRVDDFMIDDDMVLYENILKSYSCK